MMIRNLRFRTKNSTEWFCIGVLGRSRTCVSSFGGRCLIRYTTRTFDFCKKPGDPLRYSLARRHRGPGFSGALGRNRTYDLLDRNQTLYPLSYKRKRCTYSPYRESIRKTELNMQQFFENVNHAWVVRFLAQVFA